MARPIRPVPTSPIEFASFVSSVSIQHSGWPSSDKAEFGDRLCGAKPSRASLEQSMPPSLRLRLSLIPFGSTSGSVLTVVRMDDANALIFQ
jgi:hypothetical protein